ncbi:MAG: GyrI-like domain-containing protein [Clostridia bacterium]|nr:GyrI-like domain-containing protein [Clostridia bacterium]
MRIEKRNAVTLIGREGRGDGTRGGQWVPPLWRDLQLHMNEIAPLVTHDETGKPTGIWGAMSDVSRRFLPWDSEGLYLAGCEVSPDAEAPEGWAKWTLPAFEYLVVDCTPQTYGAVFQQTLLHALPDNGFELAGAVQEYYDPQSPNGGMSLFFPIARR